MKIVDFVEKKTEKVSDKDLKTYSFLFVVIGVLLIILGLVSIFVSPALFIILVAFGVFSINLKKSFKAIIEKREKIRKDEEFKKDFEARFAKDGKRDLDLLPSVGDGFILKYSYERDICFIDKNNIYLVEGHSGQQVEFEMEPDNPHDNNAVKINLNGVTLGYVYRGQTQDMINDWIDRQWPTCAYINRYNIEEGTATYKVGFYMPLNKVNSKVFALTKISKKEDELGSSRYDNLLFCSVGDEVEIDFDVFSDDYIVTKNGSEIGALSASFSNFVEDNGNKTFIGVIEEIEDIDRLKAKIRVYAV